MDKCRHRRRRNLLDTELTPLQYCDLLCAQKFEGGLPMESSGTILSENAGMTYLGNLMKLYRCTNLVCTIYHTGHISAETLISHKIPAFTYIKK